MENLFVFIVHHWLLVLLFIGLAIATLWYESKGNVLGLARVDTTRAINLINKQDAVVFDIRERSQYEKGHIAYAHNLTEAQIDSYPFEKYKGKPIIVVCHTGASAPRLGKKLKERGLEPVYFLQGGMIAWMQANLPTVKK